MTLHSITFYLQYFFDGKQFSLLMLTLFILASCTLRSDGRMLNDPAFHNFLFTVFFLWKTIFIVNVDIVHFSQLYPAFGWKDAEWLCSQWDGPTAIKVLVKKFVEGRILFHRAFVADWHFIAACQVNWPF